LGQRTHKFGRGSSMIYPSLGMLRIYVFQGFLTAGQVNLKQYFVALITAWWRSC
jgi:hypothetical protein